MITILEKKMPYILNTRLHFKVINSVDAYSMTLLRSDEMKNCCASGSVNRNNEIFKSWRKERVISLSRIFKIFILISLGEG